MWRKSWQSHVVGARGGNSEGEKTIFEVEKEWSNYYFREDHRAFEGMGVRLMSPALSQAG